MSRLSVIPLWLLLLSVAYSHFKTKHKEETAPLDALKAVRSFPYLAMVYVSSDDPEFQCLTATLTYLNEATNESTYVWHFKSPVDHRSVVRRSIFEFWPAEKIDQLHFMLDGDQCEVYTASLLYTDYENCAVVTAPYYGEDLCILWVPLDVVDNIPENCLKAHHDACPVEYRAYESDICVA